VTVLADKAATLDNQELVYASFPIEKWENGPDGSVYVYGRATTPEVDTDDQVVDSTWSGKALQAWMDTGPNLRVMHNSQRDPAGSGVKVEINRDGDGAHWVKSKVDEPVAVRLVKGGHLRAYSVGIAKPVIERDMTGKARGGIIRGGSLCELSLVDRPANVSCTLSLVKAAKDGHAEFPGTLDASSDFLAKADAPVVTKAATPGDGTVNVDLPADVSLSISPADLAKLTTFKQRLVKQGAIPAVTKVAEPDSVDAALKAVMDAESAVYKRDIDTATRRRLAAEGHALPNLSYPIENEGDLQNAARLARSGHGDVAAATRLIGREARRLGVPNPMKPKKGGKKATKSAADAVTRLGQAGAAIRAAHKASSTKSATAEPQVTKCMKCMGKGMVDGSACTECKRGGKMAKRMAKKAAASAREAVHAALEPDAQKRGKMKALCPGCGAKQNHKHEFCTECGKQLPAMPPMVAKNHDFMCLGCGHDLDKGEKFCPGCGKENPGHNPMADMKIPMNSDKAAQAGKDRVAKGKKKGKMKDGKMPFGGHQAKPFGSDADEKDDAKKTATKGNKQGIGKKPKAGHKPTPGEAGGVNGAHEMPAPRHREPDGAEVEAFEADAHLEDGDNEKPTKLEAPTLKSSDPETAAAMALKALDVPQHLGALHALTCPAYHPEDVAKAFPHASFAGIDPMEWHAGALEKAASAPLAEAQGALAIYEAAVALKSADPYMLAELRAAAHKAFRDANPGPASFPEPGQISPTRFNRPYISEGHGAASPGYMGPHHAKLPEVGGVVSTDYNRPYLDVGHASESPDNQHTPGPMQPPARTGMPTHEPAQGFMSSNAIASMQHSMAAMHDHISRRFPDVCPMESSMHIASNPVPVPHGVPQPSKAPGARKAAKKAEARARKAAKVKARKAAKAMAAKRRKLEAQVLKGKLSVDDARVKMGLKPFTAKGMQPLPPVAPPESPLSVGPAAPVAAALDPAALEAAISKATAKATKPLAAALKSARRAQAKQDKAMRKQAKVLDAIASQPDTSASPMRMAALTKTATSVAPAVPQTVAATAEQAQATQLRLLHAEMLNSPDPGRREAARAEYINRLGIAPVTHDPMTPPAPMTIPMRG